MRKVEYFPQSENDDIHLSAIYKYDE